MQEKYDVLKLCLAEIDDLERARAVLGWDQNVYMPPGGAAARGRQLATLSKIIHQKSTHPDLGNQISDLEEWASSHEYDSDEAALLRACRRDFDNATKMPEELVSELTQHASKTYHTWEKARPANDFASVCPLLEKTLELSRRVAECFEPEGSIMDPLIDYMDPGMTAASTKVIFDELREGLVPIVRKIIDEGSDVDDACVRKQYPSQKQLAFGLSVAQDFGYDTSRGRQDLTAHPFETTFDVNDVRITTRVDEHFLGEALFSTLHEAGHAMYEQGLAPNLARSPLASGASSGVHESQSRLWENVVGRSRPFWNHYFPKIQDAFPEQLAGVSVEEFYKANNKVSASLIRTDADEVTYNLHVMLRFDLELDMLEGRLAVKDLPEAWNARLTETLGVTPPNDSDGCLQDVHWFSHTIGGCFQGYTLGNVMSALWYDQALQAHPSIADDIGQGKFSTLLGWLQKNIYCHGRKFTVPELLERVTGSKDIDLAPYFTYLKSKYGDLYSLDL